MGVARVNIGHTRRVPHGHCMMHTHLAIEGVVAVDLTGTRLCARAVDVAITMEMVEVMEMEEVMEMVLIMGVDHLVILVSITEVDPLETLGVPVAQSVTMVDHPEDLVEV